MSSFVETTDLDFAQGGGCRVVVLLNVRVTAIAAGIGPTETDVQAGEVACPSNLMVYRWVVDLARPLGARKLYHPPPAVP